jgi:hypothetical protein
MEKMLQLHLELEDRLDIKDVDVLLADELLVIFKVIKQHIYVQDFMIFVFMIVIKISYLEKEMDILIKNINFQKE